MYKNKKLKILILITVIVIIVGATLWLITDEQPQSVVIVADDGKAELRISENALPEGVRSEDIKIIKLPDDESFDFDVVYRLEPDGLQLNKPVEVVVKVDNPESFVPEIWHISANNFEMLDNVNIEINANNNGDTIISGEITHFSNIVVIVSGFFEISLSPIDDQYVDEKSFYVPVSVSKDTSEIERSGIDADRGLVKWTERIGDWSLAGELKSYGRGPEGYGKEEGTIITPIEVWGVPQYIEMTNSYFESGASFTCKAPGSARIKYIVNIFYRWITAPLLESERKFFGESKLDKSDTVTISSAWFRCLAQDEKPLPDTSVKPDQDDSNGVIIGSEDLVRCDQVCGVDENGVSRYSPETSLEECSNTSQVFLCIQNKEACYNYLIPRGWQTDSNCCCKDEPVITYAGDRINCGSFKGWDANGYAVDRWVVYPFGESTKSAAECK